MEGRASPSPFFDAIFYMRAYPDVKDADWNPVMHYIRHGWREGLTPHPGFDVNRYIANHPQVDFKTIDPLQHCIRTYRSIKWVAGASSLERPDAAPYSELAFEQRQLNALFDAEYYLSMYEDVEEAGIDPFLHYALHGWRENRNPSPESYTGIF